MRRSFSVLLLLTGTLACKREVDLSGRWDHRATLSGTSPSYSYNCNMTGLTLELTQSGSTISGTYSGSVAMDCSPPFFLGAMSGQVSGAVESGDKFKLDFDPTGWQHAGSAGEDALEGTMTATFDVIGGATLFSGNFLSVRQ